MKTIDGHLFECTKCGKCCRWDGIVLLNGADVRRLAIYLGIDEDSFLKKYVEKSVLGNVLVNKKNSKECIFLKDNLCTVNDVKPDQCEKFPTGYNKKCPGFKIDRSASMQDYAAAVKTVLSKKAQSEDYEKAIVENLYKDLNTSVRSMSVTAMALEAGIDSYLSESTVKIASLDDLFSFDRVDKSHLIHKATKDLWTIDADKSGNVQITRLFDSAGEPIKG